MLIESRGRTTLGPVSKQTAEDDAGRSTSTGRSAHRFWTGCHGLDRCCFAFAIPLWLANLQLDCEAAAFLKLEFKGEAVTGDEIVFHANEHDMIAARL